MGAHGLFVSKKIGGSPGVFHRHVADGLVCSAFLSGRCLSILKKNMVKSALVEVSNNIDENNLDEIISKIQSAGIEVRIVDSNGVDRLNTKQTSLAEYTTEQLIEFVSG